jgi:hypothetical protein
MGPRRGGRRLTHAVANRSNQAQGKECLGYDQFENHAEAAADQEQATAAPEADPEGLEGAQVGTGAAAGKATTSFAHPDQAGTRVDDPLRSPEVH